MEKPEIFFPKILLTFQRNGKSAVKVIIWKGGKKGKHAENKEKKVLLIKLHNLKYRAYDKNHNFALGCTLKINNFHFFPP